MKTPQQILSQAREEFEKKFQDPMEKKYGKGFALYCSFCKGDWRDEVLSWHTSTLQSFIEAEIERLEGVKKVGDFSESALLTKLEGLPRNDENIKVLITMACNGRQNVVIDDQISHLKELLVTLKK